MGDHMVSESEEDDPVVREVPLINSKDLGETLELFQYPLKTKHCTNEHNIKKCFYKPKNKIIKLELGINVDSPNFDHAKAVLIAEEVDGDTENPQDKFFENNLVDKIFLESSINVKEPYKYAAAIYNGKEIHFTGLKDIFQFRPAFPYMAKRLKKRRGVDNNDPIDEQAGPSSAEEVTVKFKSNDRGDKSDNSYRALQDKIAEEAWIECCWHEKNSVLSSVERLKLISENTEDLKQTRNLSQSEYFKVYLPPPKEKEPVRPSLPSDMLSLHALKALPIAEQCRLLLKNAQIIDFEHILLSLAGGLTADVLLKNLPNVAMLVRGNWVVKSEILYPDGTCSAICGVPAELMCRARDYVLYLFTKNQYVERKKVISILNIPSEEIKEIFTGISKLRRHNREWELKFPTDQEFINTHADLVKKQNLLWEHRFNQLNEYLKDNKGKRRKSRSESKSISEDGKIRNGPSFSSDNDSGTEKGKSPVVSRKNKSIKVESQISDINS